MSDGHYLDGAGLHRFSYELACELLGSAPVASLPRRLMEYILGRSNPRFESFLCNADIDTSRDGGVTVQMWGCHGVKSGVINLENFAEKRANDASEAVEPDATCEECFGTGFLYGFGMPCSKGCKC